MDDIEQLRVLLIGNGGREHALAWKLSQSSRVETIYVVPGNGGIARGLNKVECVDTVKADEFPALIAFAKENSINFVVPGPEATLVAGIESHFREGKYSRCLSVETLADGCTKPASDALDPLKRLPVWKAPRFSPKISWLDGKFQQQSIETSTIMGRRNHISIVFLIRLCLRQTGCKYILEPLLHLLHHRLTHGSRLKSKRNP